MVSKLGLSAQTIVMTIFIAKAENDAQNQPTWISTFLKATLQISLKIHAK